MHGSAKNVRPHVPVGVARGSTLPTSWLRMAISRTPTSYASSTDFPQSRLVRIASTFFVCTMSSSILRMA
jgi:hypothetical protein